MLMSDDALDRCDYRSVRQHAKSCSFVKHGSQLPFDYWEKSQRMQSRGRIRLSIVSSECIAYATVSNYIIDIYHP